MKKIFLFFFVCVSILYSSDTLNEREAYKTCLKKGQRLPSIVELIKIKSILKEGIYWSVTAFNNNPGNYLYWVLQVNPDGTYKKGLLSKNKEIFFKCIKTKKIPQKILTKKEATEVFKAIYKNNVIVFPIGFLSFIGIPQHTLDNSVKPYNFWQFQIRLNTPIPYNKMKKVLNKIIAYDTILMGRVLNIKPLDKYGFEYSFLTTPTDMLEPYILPDESIR